MPEIQIVPAILAKTKEEFEEKVRMVAPYVSRVQIDVMDGIFVPNQTLNIDKIGKLPKDLVVEYHLMVENPMEYVRKIGKKNAIYEMHIESFTKVGGRGGKGDIKAKAEEIFEALREVRKIGGKAGLALSPDTPANEVEQFLPELEIVLVMTVYPGFSGQKYLSRMESKMRWLANQGACVEVDGGIEVGTARRAAAAGARLLGAASAIFSKPSIKGAIEALEKDAKEGKKSFKDSSCQF
ncbi:MAG: hypothetical protein QW275_00645 [Candidatus Anstonellaceae archaeon]